MVAWIKLEKMWLRSLIETIRSLPDGKYETINQVRRLIGMSAENFDALLETLSKSDSGILSINGALDIEVELIKATDDMLGVRVRFDVARGEVELRYSFAIGDWQTKIPGEKLPRI